MPQRELCRTSLDQAMERISCLSACVKAGQAAHLLHSASRHSLRSACLGSHSQKLMPWPRSEMPCAWGQPGDGTTSWCGGCAGGGLLFTLSPWPSLMPRYVHLSLRSSFTGWDRCSWGIPHRSKSHLFADFQLSSPALLQVGACPVLVQSSGHKAKVWGSCELACGGTLSSCAWGMSERHCVWLLCPRTAESSRGKLLLSYLCTVTLERKLEVTVIVASCPCSPGLGRETVLIVTVKPAISWPSSFGGKTQREGCWILLQSASLTFH